jgi:hypothetical protein
VLRIVVNIYSRIIENKFKIEMQGMSIPPVSKRIPHLWAAARGTRGWTQFKSHREKEAGNDRTTITENASVSGSRAGSNKTVRGSFSILQ